MAKQYRCVNAACPLGTFQKPGGLFYGGISADGLQLLTGRPAAGLVKGVDYGDGFCTNCGTKGEEHDPAAEAVAAVDEQIKALQAVKKELLG